MLACASVLGRWWQTNTMLIYGDLGRVWSMTSLWILEPLPRLNLTHYSVNGIHPKVYHSQ